MSNSTILQKALTRRGQLRTTLHRLPEYQELQRLDTFIAMYRQFEGAEHVVDGGEPTHEMTVGEIFGSPEGIARKTIPDLAAEICAEKGEPIPLQELVSQFRDRGRPIGGKNPPINLSSVLSRDPRFENVAGRGWQLTITKEKPDEESSEPPPFLPTGDGG